MLLESLYVDRAELENRTGWRLEPEGLCKGETCIPIALEAGGEVDVRRLAERLKMPLVHDAAAGLWCLGPESGGHALTSARAHPARRRGQSVPSRFSARPEGAARRLGLVVRLPR